MPFRNATTRFHLRRSRAYLTAFVAVCGATGTPASAQFPTRPGNLVVNEIHAAPPSGQPEFVELYNRGSTTLSLQGLSLEDSRRSPAVPRTSDVPELAPGGYLVLTGDEALLRSRFAIADVIEMRPWPALNNGGDLVLISIDSVTMDSVAYGADRMAGARSSERIHPEAPSVFEANWAPSVEAEGATPGQANSVYVEDRTAPDLLAAEYSKRTVIDVVFSEPVDVENLLAGVVRLDGVPLDAVGLDATGRTITFSAEPRGRALEIPRVSDYSGNSTGPSTILVALRPGPGDLALTEIMFDPGGSEAGPSAPEFIEVTNFAETPESLAEVILKVGISGEQERRFVLHRSGHVLLPGAAAVVYAEPVSERLDHPEATSSLYDFHPRARTAEGLVLLPVSGSALGLRNSSDTVTLATMDGTLMDSVTYFASWHDDRYLSTAGRSLERVPDRSPLWVSSPDARGATPGRLSWPEPPGESPASGELVLSEIMFDPIQDSDDGRVDQMEYIEIANLSGWTIDLDGLYLLSGTGDRPLSDSTRLAFGPTPLAPKSLALSFVLPSIVGDERLPGAEYLAEVFPGAGAIAPGALLPRRSALSLGNDGERLQLRSRSGAVLDEVSYSPSWHHFLVLDGSGISLERIDLSGPSDDPGNWTSSAAVSGGTPAAQNSVSPLPATTHGTRLLLVEPKTFTPDGDGVEDIVRIQITSDAPGGAAARVRVFDLLGRIVKEFGEVPLHGAPVSLFWEGDDDRGGLLPSGVYVVLAQVVGRDVTAVRAAKAPVALIH